MTNENRAGDSITDLHPDHLRLLTLANAALLAQDNRTLWRYDIQKAADDHCRACDELWEELSQQVDARHGKIPTLEHPTQTKRRRARQIRAEIVNACRDAIAETLDQIIDGGLLDDDE